MLGKFKLNPVQCTSLGAMNTQYNWAEEGKTAIDATQKIMQKAGFSQFVLRDSEFFAST